MCEIWWHKDCIEGMTEAYLDQITKSEKMFGWSGFLCGVCWKFMAKLNKGMKEMEGRVAKLGEREKKEPALKVEVLEKRVGECKGEIKVVETGLTKAKEDVNEEMKEKLKERGERNENIVVYGLVKSKKNEPKERVKEDERKVKELWEQMEVEVEEGETEVKFRAGKQKEDGKPRPLILTVKDTEKRETFRQWKEVGTERGVEEDVRGTTSDTQIKGGRKEEGK